MNARIITSNEAYNNRIISFYNTEINDHITNCKTNIYPSLTFNGKMRVISEYPDYDEALDYVVLVPDTPKYELTTDNPDKMNIINTALNAKDYIRDTFYKACNLDYNELASKAKDYTENLIKNDVIRKVIDASEELNHVIYTNKPKVNKLFNDAINNIKTKIK